jgi:uncharacterized membrane-anchored protein
METPEFEATAAATGAASSGADDSAIDRPGMSMHMPQNHPQRFGLNDEVHARPPERIAAPSRVSYLMILADKAQRQETWRMIGALALEYGATPPDADADHYSADIGPMRLKAERHTEFVRLKFILPGLGSGGESQPFADPAIGALPAEWIAALPGELLVATQVAIVPNLSGPPWPGAREVRSPICESTRTGSVGY